MERFIGYEYQDVTTKNSMVSVYADGYRNFGWQVEKMAAAGGRALDSVTLKFKRDRKTPNKMEMARLQRKFDACISDILSLESSKYALASAAAYLVGLVGTAFMTASVFFMTGGMVLQCVLLAVPALVGWLLPYFLYERIVKKKTEAAAPLIQEKYDEIYGICQKGNRLCFQAAN